MRALWAAGDGERLRRGSIAAALLWLLACSGDVSDRPSGAARRQTAVDGWVRAPVGLDLDASDVIPAHAVMSVLDARQAQAQTGLAARTWQALEPAAAKVLVGDQAESGAASGVPVLLRSVKSEEGPPGLAQDDRYVVRWQRGTVVVSHLADRRGPARQLRHAIVVWLPEEPTEAYVECLTSIQDHPGD